MPDQGAGPSLGGWHWSSVPGAYWGEFTRAITGDSVSPYNALTQAIWSTNDVTHLDLSGPLSNLTVDSSLGGNSLYSQHANYVPGTQPLKTLGTLVYPNPGVDPISAPVFWGMSQEGWPINITGTPLPTIGSNIVGGSGTSYLSEIVADGMYVFGCAIPSVFYIVDSIQSDTQLTLKSNFTGPLVSHPTYHYTWMYGPFNMSLSSAPGWDAHAPILQRSETTFEPVKLWETYGAYSADSGTTWPMTSIAVWDLTTGDQRPDGIGSTVAAGCPFLPGLLRYEEALAGTISSALYGIVGNASGAGITAEGSGQQPCVWPATASASANASGSYKDGYLPAGARLRLSASWYGDNVAANPYGWSDVVLGVMKALRELGVIVMDWTTGYSFGIEGIGDHRWSNTDLGVLNAVPMTAFEVIDTIKPQTSLTGPSTAVHGEQSTWTVTYLMGSTNYSTNVYLYYSTNGGSTWSLAPNTGSLSDTTPSTDIDFTPPTAGSYLLRITTPNVYWIVPDPIPVSVS